MARSLSGASWTSILTAADFQASVDILLPWEKRQLRRERNGIVQGARNLSALVHHPPRLQFPQMVPAAQRVQHAGQHVAPLTVTVLPELAQMAGGRIVTGTNRGADDRSHSCGKRHCVTRGLRRSRFPPPRPRSLRINICFGLRSRCMDRTDRDGDRSLRMAATVSRWCRPTSGSQICRLPQLTTTGIPSIGGQYDHQRTRRESWRSAVDQTRLTFQKYGPVASITPVRLLR